MNRGVAVVALAIILAWAEAAPAQGLRQNLDGWGPFRFDMDLDSAKKAGGPSYSVNQYGQLSGSVEVAGLPFEARVMFRRGYDRINSFVLSRRGISDLEGPACEKALDELEALIVAKYGPSDVPAIMTLEPENVYSRGRARMAERRIKFAFKDGAEVVVGGLWQGSPGSSGLEKCSMFVAYNEPVKSDKQGF